MSWLYQPLLLLIARSVQSDLAHQIQYLKAENAILRKHLPRCPKLTTDERLLLVKLGLPVGPGMRVMVTIVAYMTWRRWVLEYRAQVAENQDHGFPRGDIY